MNTFYSRPLISCVPLANGLRLIVLISSLVVLASSLAAAQQNPVGSAESPAAAAADHSEEKVASSRGDGTGGQTNSFASQPQGQSDVDSGGSSATPAQAPSESSPESAAKDAAQNPVAHVISVPLQNNTYFNVGQYQRAVNVLLVEPVIPFRLTNNWILITRTITPLIYEPRVTPTQSETFGLGNINPQFYLSPAHPGSVVWGVGPQLWLPTATDKTLGVNKWGGGPAVVVLTKKSHWLFGALVNNAWAGTGGRKLNQMTLNPFVFYNFSHGWYLMTSPVITANWEASGDDRWTVPVGGGFGRVFKMGRQLLNARAQFWNDVKSPTGGPSWTMQTQVQLLFPRK
jgi:hypothetical protein